MGLVVDLKAKVFLSDVWLDKGTFDEDYINDRQAFIAILSEDIFTFIEEAGGLEKIIENYYWKE